MEFWELQTWKQYCSFHLFPTVTSCMPLRPCLYPLSCDTSPPSSRGSCYNHWGFGILIVSCSYLKGPAYPADGLSCTPSAEVLDHCPRFYFSSVNCLLSTTVTLQTLPLTWIVSSPKKIYLASSALQFFPFYIPVFLSHPQTLHFCF